MKTGKEALKLSMKQLPSLPERKTSDNFYWQSFKNVVFAKETTAISHVCFSPSSPCDYAVTTSTRVNIYNSQNNEIRRTLSRFKDVVHAGDFRRDGRLFVAGDASGLVQIFDLNSRSLLRHWKEHERPVRVARFSTDNVTVMTAGDDQQVKGWDLSAEKSHLTMKGHKDYIRCGQINQATPSTWVTGSYDHTVKLWDTRASTGEQCTLTLDHGAPVEAVLVFPHGGTVVSAGDTQIKIWDVLSGGRLLHTLSNHHKTITSLAFDSSCTRLLSGSLDEHVKIYDVGSYEVVHSLRLPSPILSIAVSASGSHFAAGMADGTLNVKQRAEDLVLQGQAEMLTRSTEAALLKQGAGKMGVTETTEKKRRTRLEKYEIYLKSFQYGRALDQALRTRSPVVVVSMLEELDRRGDGLRAAIHNRDDVALQPLLQFIITHITNPRFADILLFVANMILDEYSPLLAQSSLFDQLVLTLKHRVRSENVLLDDLTKTLGILDVIIANSRNMVSDDLLDLPPPLFDPLEGSGALTGLPQHAENTPREDEPTSMTIDDKEEEEEEEELVEMEEVKAEKKQRGKKKKSQEIEKNEGEQQTEEMGVQSAAKKGRKKTVVVVAAATPKSTRKTTAAKAAKSSAKKKRLRPQEE